MQDCLRPLLSVLNITSPEVTRQLLVAMVAAGSLFPFWPPYPLSFTLLPRLVCGDRSLLRAPSEDKSGCSLSFPARMGPPSLYTRGLGPYLWQVSLMYPTHPGPSWPLTILFSEHATVCGCPGFWVLDQKVKLMFDILICGSGS